MYNAYKSDNVTRESARTDALRELSNAVQLSISLPVTYAVPSLSTLYVHIRRETSSWRTTTLCWQREKLSVLSHNQ
jgi:hypothetical protein